MVNVIPPFKSLAPEDHPWARAVTERLTGVEASVNRVAGTANTLGSQQSNLATAVENQAGQITEVAEQAGVGPAATIGIPTVPILQSQVATIAVTWDGLYVESEEEDPEVPEADPKRIGYMVAEASLTLDYGDPEDPVDPFIPVGPSFKVGGTSFLGSEIGASVGDIVYVRLHAYTLDGQTSNVGEPASVILVGVEAPDIDAAIIEAIDEAQTDADAALTAANGKNTNYYQATMPTGGTYLVGDTWFDTDDSNKLYTWSGSAWVLTQDAASAAQAAATAQTAAGTALTAANGKNTNYYGPSTPTPPGGGFKTGDNWFDTDDDYKLYVWSGSAWVLAQDSATAATAAGNAQTTANSKSTNYFQTTAPTPPGGGFKVGDNWFDTDDNNKLYVWSGSAWVLAQDSAAATTLAGTKNSIWHQASAPAGTSHRVGDVWWDTDDGNKMYEWNGSSWIANEFGGSAIANAAITNAKIQDAAVTNAKILDATILAAKIGDAQITSAKIQDAAITTAKIGDAQINAAKIADAQITNAKIADLAVTNAKISDLNASKINAGVISADRIGANTISASKLLVGDFENYFYDPTFSDPAGYSPWTVVGNSIEKNGTGAQHGTYYAHLDFPVVEGEKFRFQWTRTNVTSSGGSASMYVQWLNSSNALISVTQVGTTTVPGVVTSAEITAPANAVKARPGFYTEPTMGAGVRVKVSDVLIRRMVMGNLIVDGAITAGSAIITDGAITNAKISALDAAKITTGTLNSDRIASNSISTQKLLITSLENLIQDSSFEYASGAWALGGTATTGTTNPRSGARALTAPTQGAAYVPAAQTGRFAVQPGEQYRISAWVRKAAGTSALNGVTLRFGTSATETGTLTSSADLALTPNGTGTTYVRITATYTVPAGVYWVRPEVVMRDTTAGQTYYVDDVECFKMSTGELIVDGAIDGKVVTGATVRTAASGQRIQLDTGGLKSYNAANVVTGELQASSGGLLLSGKLRSGSGNQRVEMDSDSIDFFDTAGTAGASMVGYNNSPGNVSTAGVRITASGGLANVIIGGANTYDGGFATLQTPYIWATERVQTPDLDIYDGAGSIIGNTYIGSGQKLVNPGLVAGATVINAPGAAGRVDFTNQASIKLDDIFTDKWTRYKIYLSITAMSAAGSIFLRFSTAGGTVNSSSNYQYTRDYSVSGTTFGVSSANQSRIELAGGSGVVHDSEITILGAYGASTTRLAAVTTTMFNTPPYVSIPAQVGGHYYGALDARGFQILPTSGTFSGTLTVYGLV